MSTNIELDNLITALADIVVAKINLEKNQCSQDDYETARNTFKTYHDIYVNNRIQNILNNQNLRARLSNSKNKNKEQETRNDIIFD